MLLIGRYGHLRHSGRNFNKERTEHLAPFKDFVPVRKIWDPLQPLKPITSFLLKNSFTRNLVVQTAFVNRSIRAQGGHLHLPFFNISYIRIPRAASTSVSWAVVQSIYPDLKAKKLTSQEINFLTDVNLKRDVSEDASDVFFTVVRNPFARIVSVYRSFFETKSEPFLYADYLFGIFSKDISFREFVARLQFIPDLLMDQHIKPQHHFIDIYKKREQKVVILKLEKHGEIDSFLSIYNMHIPHLNQSEDSYDYRSYYDLETFQRVYTVYRKDIKEFKYETDLYALKKYITEMHSTEVIDNSLPIIPL